MRDRIIFSDNQQVSARQISRALFLEMAWAQYAVAAAGTGRVCAGQMVYLPFYLAVF